jgi:carboxyl-terminal processing protease
MKIASTLLTYLSVTAALILIARMTGSQPPSVPLLNITLETAAKEKPATPTDFRRLGEEILQKVEREFYDTKRAAAWVKKHRKYAANISDQAVFAARTNEALAELKTSHTGYYTPGDVAYYALLDIFRAALGVASLQVDSIGADFARLPEGYYVRRVFEGSPAEKAGLRRGDYVGAEFSSVSAFQGRAGKATPLTVRRKRDNSPLTLSVIPRRIAPKTEWLQAQRDGSRLIWRNGRSIGYIPMFSGAGDEYRQVAEEAIVSQFPNADALILDFRDGYGGLSPDFMNLFNPLIPALTSIDRKGQRQRYLPAWRKPLLILINGGTRSGKEVIAYTVKKRRIGTLVGERTAGAVVGGRAFLLSDRSLLYLAVRDVEVDGVRLEENGVEPDVLVRDRLPYAMGADPQLEKAIALAAEKSGRRRD